MTLLEALQSIETILCRAHANLQEALKVISDGKDATQKALKLDPPAEIKAILEGVESVLCMRYNDHHTASMAIASSKNQIQLAIMSL